MKRIEETFCIQNVSLILPSLHTVSYDSVRSTNGWQKKRRKFEHEKKINIGKLIIIRLLSGLKKQ